MEHRLKMKNSSKKLYELIFSDLGAEERFGSVYYTYFYKIQILQVGCLNRTKFGSLRYDTRSI